MDHGKPIFGALAERLETLPFALTIADISHPDQPLIFLNRAFSDMTGYGKEMLGQNCRFLQTDLENESARAEIRLALARRERVQILLRNRRKTGEAFLNLLFLQALPPFETAPGLAIGSQYDLGDVLTRDRGRRSLSRQRQEDVLLEAKRLTLERRRLMSDAAVRMVQSWCVLNDAVS